jgi:PilZ domain
MIVQATATLVRTVSSQVDFDKRHAERHECVLDSRTSPLDDPEGFSWGASIRDLSRTGVGLIVCFPFRTGTYLAVELQGSTMLSRVVHVRDRNDGSYQVGCEFLRALTDDELDRLI